MTTRPFAVLCLAATAAFSAVPAMAAEKPAHDFTGAKKCAVCHTKLVAGNQFERWKSGPHAKAFETLGTPAAREIASKRGIEDPQKSGACLKCHSTAYYFSESLVAPSVPAEEGVSCESCHGPGSGYSKLSVMKDPAAARAAGLLEAGETKCLECHNEQSPTFKPFVFEEARKRIEHKIE